MKLLYSENRSLVALLVIDVRKIKITGKVENVSNSAQLLVNVKNFCTFTKNSAELLIIHIYGNSNTKSPLASHLFSQISLQPGG